MNEITRKMASVRAISNITPIEGADMIETAWIGGWPVVTQKSNNFKIGDLICYFELDAWIPNEIAPFLSKGKEPREYNGVKGEKLRTIKLRGQVSQGLIMPLMEIAIILNDISFNEGDDLTNLLNIQKWEASIPAQLAGQMKGGFPSFIRKTDEERVQNLEKELQKWVDQNQKYEVTLKIDGSSMTAYFYNGEVGVCSRNIDLKINEENKDNAYIKMANRTGLISALTSMNKNIAVQGELWGEGIQGNHEGVKDQFFSVFNIFDIDNQRYLTPNERYDMMNKLYKNGFLGDHVPVLSYGVSLPSSDISDILKMADGPSMKNSVREGIVFKALNGSHSFKAISNVFLLKSKE